METVTVGGREEQLDYLRVERGLWSWLTTTDHKRIAVMFFIAIISASFVGGLLAVLIRLELLTPASDVFSLLNYDRLFTMHGVIMVWLFLVPIVPSTFGNFLLPIMIGAKDLAFPRLNLASFYVYLLGAAVIVYGFFTGAADAGWTFYPPYSTDAPTAVGTIAAGVFILGVSSTMTGINLIVTTHTMRAEGLTWGRLPLFVWAAYSTSIVLVFATPVLAMVLLLVALERAFGLAIFSPVYGGDPILYQHLFWFYSHPAVYIMILPSMGIISEVVETYARKFTLSYPAMVLATLGLAFVGFLVWGHHMFTAGMSEFDAVAFSFLSMLVAIPSAVKAFVWLGTLFRGSISFRTPLLYFVAFIFLFGWGGFSGLAIASPSLDVYWQDTFFIIAHFHFVMSGAASMAIMAGLHYWWPKMFGRMYSERVALLAALAIGGGFILTFSPLFLAGNAGMLRRHPVYLPDLQTVNVISTVGSWLLASGVVLVFANLLASLKYGRRAEANPWQSRGFEWMTPSPPPKHNFLVPPVITRRPHNYDEA